MPPAPPAALQLASRLRQLRQEVPRLTQEKLARVFSQEEGLAATTVSSWESLKSPRLPPDRRLRAYARFFVTPRSVQGKPKLFALEELTQDERKTYDRLEAELLQLRSAASGHYSEENSTFNRSWLFEDSDRVTFVCAPLPDGTVGPFGNPGNPDYTELRTYADIDALFELFGHIRAENPAATVHFKSPSNLMVDDLTSHLILLGGVFWSDMVQRLSEIAKIPIRKVNGPPLESGEVFVVDAEGQERVFGPRWEDEDGKRVLIEDIGLLARMPNPLNANRTLTICNGIHSRGVYGAVRSLTDRQLRDGNERYISANFGDARSFGILMSVNVIRNEALTPDFNSSHVVLYQWAQDASEGGSTR